MFKELGEFIDNVARATGRIIKDTVSNNDGDIDPGDIQGLPVPDDHYDKIIVKFEGEDEDINI